MQLVARARVAFGNNVETTHELLPASSAFLSWEVCVEGRNLAKVWALCGLVQPGTLSSDAKEHGRMRSAALHCSIQPDSALY